MSGFSGFVAAAAQIGVQNVLIKPLRGIFNPVYSDQGKAKVLPSIVAQAVLEERHIDRLEITEHPVEYGAAISDHAFKLPAEIVLTLGWSNSQANLNLLNSVAGVAATLNPAAALIAGAVSTGMAVQSMISGANKDQVKDVYSLLLQLQDTRALFSVYSGKRIYKNMICRTLAMETDFETENSLIITMECQQVLLVNTSVVSLPASSQKAPEETGWQIIRGKTQLVPQ